MFSSNLDEKSAQRRSADPLQGYLQVTEALPGTYFKASDLANGRFWYVPLGLSAYVLNFWVAILAYSQDGMSISTLLFTLAAGCAVVHAIGTSRAVPAGLGFLRLKDEDEAILNKSFDRFARWVIVRAIFGAPMFVAILLGLMMLS